MSAAQLVEARGREPRAGLVAGQRRDLADEAAHRAAELERPAEGVAVPERQPPGTPGAGVTSTRSWVMSSIRQLEVPSENTSPTRDS